MLPGILRLAGCRSLVNACACRRRVLRRRLGKEGVSEAALLCTAVFEGDLKLLRLLLRAGAHVDAGDYDKRTALHIAAAEGNLAAVGGPPTGGCFVAQRALFTALDCMQRLHAEFLPAWVCCMTRS